MGGYGISLPKQGTEVKKQSPTLEIVKENATLIVEEPTQKKATPDIGVKLAKGNTVERGVSLVPTYKRIPKSELSPGNATRLQHNDRSLLTKWRKFVTELENNIFAFAPDKNKKGQRESHGNISAGEKVLHTLKGIGKIFTTMLKNPVETGLAIVAFAAISSFAAPLAPLLIAGGFTIGTIGALANLQKAENAKTDYEARKAYQNFGANLFTAVTSLFGARAAVKSAKASGVGVSIDPEKAGTLRNLAECYKLSFGSSTNGTSIYKAVGHTWAMKMNKLRKDQVDSDYTKELKGKKATAESELAAKKKLLDNDDPTAYGAKQKLEHAKAEVRQREIDANALETEAANAEFKIKQLQDDLANLEGTYQRARAGYTRGSQHVSGYSDGAKAGEAVYDLGKIRADINNTQRAMDRYTNGTFTAEYDAAQVNLEQARTKLAAAESAFKKLEGEVAEATTALNKSKDAITAAEDVPSFFGSLLTGAWRSTQANGLIQR